MKSATKEPRKYDYYTIQRKNDYGEPYWAVYGWGTYPRGSVLAGQPMKTFLESYPTEAEALTAYPEAKPGGKWIDPQVTLDHLPGEDDPVPGGMFPDDIGDAV